MRLSELSERSGVSTATIKYYLRERLLPPGRAVTATQAEYDESHLRRLRLVRALIQVGRLPVATTREVLRAVDDDSLDHHTRLGAAVWAIPHIANAAPALTEETEPARQIVDTLLELADWTFGRQMGPLNPSYRMLVTAVMELLKLEYPCDADHLLPYAKLATGVAVTEIDELEALGTPSQQVEAAVAMTVLYEPVLLSLRRMAQAEESSRRFSET
jgi:DNA-binding transcriptional MerR regulator